MAFEVPQPINYGQPENLGVTIGQGMGSLGNVLAQAKQQEQEQAAKQQLQQFQQAFGQAYAAGDRDSMRQLAAQFPGQFEQVQKGLSILNTENKDSVGTAAADLRMAAASGDENAIRAAAQRNASTLEGLGTNADDLVASFKENPQQFNQLADMIGLHALGPDKYFDVMDKQQTQQLNQAKLAEQIRSNQAGESLQIRGQDITVRGQNLTDARSKRTAQMIGSNRMVQLSDGRTVTVGGKLHGAGANAFYEGVDDSGNMVRVPASAIAAPPTSAASAQNYAMSKDLATIESANPDDVGFMTGITGGSGSTALGADIRSRVGSKEQRNIYNAAQRVQGRMQNQGVAAARDMGASGINTATEAKMYFQGMPQLDYSSPEALQQSVKDIKEYTDNYNQQYNVNIGGKKGGGSSVSQQPPQPPAGGNFSSLWGD